MDKQDEKGGREEVVAVAGRLDVATCDDVEKRLVALIQGGVRKLVLDVSKLEYVSSAGLRVFIVVGKKARAAGGDMVFVNAGPHTVQILEISGFNKMFKVNPSA